MAVRGCPGANKLRGTPELTEKVCPECGSIIEIFSIDMSVECTCGFVAYNETQNCINWCRYARECVGDEIYEKFKKTERRSNK